MSAIGFLNRCTDLFSGVFSAVLGQPVLAFFAGSALVLALVALIGFVVRNVRRM